MSSKSVKQEVDSLLVECLRVPSDDGQALALELLERYKMAPVVGADYVYAPGTIPILLVAHTDTVHARPPAALYHDAVKRVLWSPSGLGADDRAGVYALASILRDGFRPHVLMTDGEERGGIGADSAARTLPAPNVRCMLQLDRAGAAHYVSYSCDSAKMRKYLSAHGLSEEIGTYSDVATLMPAWGIAGANLACGYYGQHTHAEYLRLSELDSAIACVKRMLAAPPRRRIVYEEETYHWSSNWGSLLSAADLADTQDYVPYRERERRADVEDELRQQLERREREWSRWNALDDDDFPISQR